MDDRSTTNANISEAVPGVPSESAGEIVQGAKILKLAVAFDNLQQMKLPDDHQTARLRRRIAEFDGKLVDGVEDIKPPEARIEFSKVLASKLAAGMILQQEIRTTTDLLIVAKGQEVAHAFLNKLDNFSRAEGIAKEFTVLVPVSAAASELDR